MKDESQNELQIIDITAELVEIIQPHQPKPKLKRFWSKAEVRRELGKLRGDPEQVMPEDTLDKRIAFLRKHVPSFDFPKHSTQYSGKNLAYLAALELLVEQCNHDLKQVLNEIQSGEGLPTYEFFPIYVDTQE